MLRGQCSGNSTESERIRTPLCESLVIVTQADECKDRRGDQRDERCHGHAAEERPVDKGETVDPRIEHHRPREEEEERYSKECSGQLATLSTYGEPALYAVISTLAQDVAGDGNKPSLTMEPTAWCDR